MRASARLRSGLKPLQRVCQEAHTRLVRLPRPRPAPAGVEPDRATLARRLAELEESLARDLLPYWSRNTWDGAHGFVRPPALAGQSPAGGTPLRFQARMIWTFAHAHRHGLTGGGYLELARRGVDLLVERFWDDRHGGFLPAVDDDGRAPDAIKETVEQGCAIFALAEYAAASGDQRALARAEWLYDLVAAHGAEEGAGFHEVFTRDWQRATPPGPERRLGTQLHMIETLTTLVTVTGRPRHAAALAGLVEVLRGRAIDPATGCAPPGFDRAWRPWRPPGGLRLTSYGHNVELAWILLDAAVALGEPRERGQAVALGLLDHALGCGFDDERGGLAAYGPWHGHVRQARYLSPRRLWKNWWPQAELLVALAETYRSTGEPRYGVALERQLDWVWRHQIDQTTGNWVASVDWRGGPPVPRHAEAAHDPYHNGRALMRVSRILRALGIR